MLREDDALRLTVEGDIGDIGKDIVAFMLEQIRQYTGADAYGRDAMAAVALPTEWAKE